MFDFVVPTLFWGLGRRIISDYLTYYGILYWYFFSVGLQGSEA